MINRIIKILKEKGITYKKFCEDLKYNRTQIDNWKHERSSIKASELIQIADYLGTTTNYLLYGYEPTNIKGNIANGNNNNQIYNENTATNSSDDIKKEIDRIYNVLNIYNKTKMLTYAHDLENEQKKEY